MWLGVPLLVGVGILVEFAVWLGFELPLSKLATPTAVLLSIQIAFYVSMYPVRKRYKQRGDLRPGFTLMGLYCLFIGLAGMYYAAKLGLVRVNTFTDNYVAFSIYIVVVVGIGIGLLSFLKPKRT